MRAIDATPSLSPKLREEARGLEKRLNEITRTLRGDNVMRPRNEAVPASIAERVQSAAGSLRASTGRPTKTAMENLKAVATSPEKQAQLAQAAAKWGVQDEKMVERCAKMASLLEKCLAEGGEVVSLYS